MKTELFIIAPGLWRAAHAREIAETCSGLRELDAYALPYETVTVRLRASEFMTFSEGNKAKFSAAGYLAVDVTVSMDDRGRPTVTALNEINGYRLDVTDRMTISRVPDNAPYTQKRMKMVSGGISAHTGTPEGETELQELQRQVRDFLIAVLATRNVVKERKENKLARLGIGKAKRKSGTGAYRYVTTISLPHESEMEDDTEHVPSGKAKAPHLRRGHIRKQHYGPARAFIKRVWIAPVFVNADPDFVSARKAYNVSLPATERTDERHG